MEQSPYVRFGNNGIIYGAAVLIALYTQPGTFAQTTRKPQTIMVDTFAAYKNNVFPDGWHATRKDISMYSLKNENGNCYLQANTKGGCTSIGKQLKFSADEYPFLSWKWRAHKLPETGQENIKNRNDSGAAIYVIFKGIFKLNHILKYVWSSTLPKGTVTDSPYNPRVRIIVLENGNAKIDQWVKETVNIKEDYKKHFGSEPPGIEAIAVLTDSDNTESLAAADYDEIKISANPEGLDLTQQIIGQLR